MKRDVGPGAAAGSGIARGLLKVCLILGSLAAGYPQYLDRLADLGYSPALVVSYLGLFAILAATLIAGAFTRNHAIRWTFAGLLALAAAFGDTYVRITGDYMTYSLFVSQMYSVQFIDDAIAQYWAAAVASVPVGLMLLVGFGLSPTAGRYAAGRPVGFPRRAFRVGLAAAPIAGIALLTAILASRGGAGERGLPLAYIPLAYLNLFAYESATEVVGPREPVRISRTAAPVGHDIVFIIDESVGGNYLAINAQYGVSTPLDAPPPGVRVHNFGYAAAIGSCSADVNVTLRYGGTRDAYVRINATMPSIWSYAKVAGLSTVYIDSQRTGRRTQNMMTDRELMEVDRWIQYDDVPVIDRDMAAAADLADLLNDGVPQFILMNKMGAHFPVHDKFPDRFAHHQPMLPRGLYESVADTGLRLGFTGTPSEWVQYRNSYRNTLLWNVGEFFERLFAKARLGDAVIIYTSDHGQDLHERGHPGAGTHCGGRPHPEEGLVPLVVLTGEGAGSARWQQATAMNRNRSSHYNIFPTMLQLMGYEMDRVREIYGYPLTEDVKDPFTFNTRFNARFGAEPSWMFIDLQQIVTPPPPQ